MGQKGTSYTEAAWLSIDNNLPERQIKQLVIGRKAWLFAGSENGARNASTLFSIIVSCKLAGVVLPRRPTWISRRFSLPGPKSRNTRYLPSVRLTDGSTIVAH
jgi:hypothetical protein